MFFTCSLRNGNGNSMDSWLWDIIPLSLALFQCWSRGEWGIKVQRVYWFMKLRPEMKKMEVTVKNCVAISPLPSKAFSAHFYMSFPTTMRKTSEKTEQKILRAGKYSVWYHKNGYILLFMYLSKSTDYTNQEWAVT